MKKILEYVEDKMKKSNIYLIGAPEEKLERMGWGSAWREDAWELMRDENV